MANRSKRELSNTVKKNQQENQQLNYNNQIVAVILFAISLFLFFLILIPGESLWAFSQSLVLGLFGISSIFWPILLMYIAVTTAKETPLEGISYKIFLSIILIVLFCSSVYIFKATGHQEKLNYFSELTALYSNGVHHCGSGLIGGLIGIVFVKLLGGVGARIIAFISIFVVMMFLTRTSLMQLFSIVRRSVNKIITVYKNYRSKHAANINMKNKVDFDIPLDSENLPLHPVRSPVQSVNVEDRPKKSLGKREIKKEKLKKSDESISNELIIKAADDFNKKVSTKNLVEPLIQNMNELDGYKYPPVSLLDPASEANDTEITRELQLNGKMLVETLQSFGVQTKVVDICRGPSVTRYELQPATGVKISKITNLADDIALNLAASGVRIEAPIPGKAAVGIEIPNKIVSLVKMRELIGSCEFNSAKSSLSVVVGKDIAGNVKITDLAKMPHLLIAGSTGSGKSVCINSFIISLLYKSSPRDVRLLMIDPKVVELGVYNGVPHLLVPVVTDTKKAAGALSWAVNEMLKRYKLFAEKNVRDLCSYNKIVMSDSKNEEENLEIMPQIVIIIDELADLMMAAPNEVEDSICRLAQMARAAGMHLVIATQRPSVDVITGIIKANIPSRIALAVSSQVDSRTILDSNGAEKLLGRGDMLFAPIGIHKPSRIQGCYVTDKEIESVINFVKNSGSLDYDEDVIQEIERNAVLDLSNKQDKSSSVEEEDPMLEEAIKCIVEVGQASTSLLQRRLRLGYARAGRLIDKMEQMGIVGPYEGSKPRQLKITQQQWLERNFMKQDGKGE